MKILSGKRRIWKRFEESERFHGSSDQEDLRDYILYDEYELMFLLIIIFTYARVYRGHSGMNLARYLQSMLEGGWWTRPLVFNFKLSF